MQLNNTELAPNFTIVSYPDNLGEANARHFVWRNPDRELFLAPLRFRDALFTGLNRISQLALRSSDENLTVEDSLRCRHMKTIYGWLCHKARTNSSRKRSSESWKEEFLARSEQYWLAIGKNTPSKFSDDAFLDLYLEAKSVFSPEINLVQPAPRPTSELQPE